MVADLYLTIVLHVSLNNNSKHGMFRNFSISLGELFKGLL
jgi:hypothetical protein